MDIKRALTDPEYRKTLTPEELAQLPPNPAGDSELAEGQLDDVTGGLGGLAPRPRTYGCANQLMSELCDTGGEIAGPKVRIG